MGLPLDAPFALESFTVRFEQLLELLGCRRLPSETPPKWCTKTFSA